MKKIFINIRSTLNASTGVQRYISSLLENFECPMRAIEPKRSFYYSGFKGHLWEQSYLYSKTKNQLLFSPANSGPIFHPNQIITIHDLSPIDHPEWFSTKYHLFYKNLYRILFKYTQKVVTVSNFTKNRLTHHYPHLKNNIEVIPNGIDSRKIITNTCSNDFLQKYNLLNKQFVFTLSTIEKRKNFNTILKAWELSLPHIPKNIYLLCAGAKGKGNIFKEERLLQSQSRVIFTGHVEEEELHQLYSNALVFLYASLYEGFGLPPLEAIHHGTIPVCSNIAPLKETLGNYDFFASASSPEEFSQKLIYIINNPHCSEKILSNYSDLNIKYTWAKSADKTENFLNSFRK